MFDDSATFWCAFCGEPNEIDVDLSAGTRQSYVEDCQVCCRPIVFDVAVDFDGDASVSVRAENE